MRRIRPLNRTSGRLALAGIGVLAVAALAGCSSGASGSSDAKAAVQSLKVGTQTANPGELYKYVAQQLGEFQKNHLKISLVNLANSTAQTQALQSGSLNVAMSTIAAVLAAPKSLNLRILPGSISADPALLANSTVSSPADLAGATIGVAVLGPGPQPVVEQMLKNHGVDPSKVKFIAYGAPTTRAAEMSSGKLAVAYVASSQATQFIKQSSRPLHIVLQADPKTDANVIDAFYPNLDLTNQSTLTAKKQAMVDYCHAIKNTITWMKDPSNKDQLVKYTMAWEGLKDPTETYQDAVQPALPDLISQLSQANWNKAVTLLGNHNSLAYATTVPNVC